MSRFIEILVSTTFTNRFIMSVIYFVTASASFISIYWGRGRESP